MLGVHTLPFDFTGFTGSDCVGSQKRLRTLNSVETEKDFEDF